MTNTELFVLLACVFMILLGPFAHYSFYFLPKKLYIVVCIVTFILGFLWTVQPIGGLKVFGVELLVYFHHQCRLRTNLSLRLCLLS